MPISPRSILLTTVAIAASLALSSCSPKEEGEREKILQKLQLIQYKDLKRSSNQNETGFFVKPTNYQENCVVTPEMSIHSKNRFPAGSTVDIFYFDRIGKDFTKPDFVLLGKNSIAKIRQELRSAPPTPAS